MDRRQLVITDLQAAGLPDPSQRPLHDPADLTQPAPVGRPLPRQVVLDPSASQSLPVSRRPVLPVAVQGLRPATSAAARLADQRDIVEQRHGQERLIPLSTCDTDGQRHAITVYEQVAFRAFLRPIRGVLAGEDPPKTAR